MIYLKLSDPKTNTNKYYTIIIQQDLFGHWALLRQWGRVGTKGQTKINTFESYDEARTLCNKIIKEKQRKGYINVT